MARRVWSLNTLHGAFCVGPRMVCPASAPTQSGRILQAAGFSWQKSRTWCETGVVVRKRKVKVGLVSVTDPNAAAKRG